MSALESWMKSGKYLPEILRDFHDQKDLFKAMHQTINMDNNEYAKRVDWVSGQCYVIDIFLWFMARRGYTLQRSRRKFEFVDLDQTLSKCEAQRNAEFAAAIAEKGE